MIDPAPIPPTQKGTLGSPFFRPATNRPGGLGGFDDLLTPDAAGADSNPFGGAVHQDSHRLQVGHPAALPSVVGVADMVASRGTLGAHRANSCHISTSPLVMLVVDQAIKFSLGSQLAQGKSCHGH